MDRRTVLALTSTTVGPPLSGCVGTDVRDMINERPSTEGDQSAADGEGGEDTETVETLPPPEKDSFPAEIDEWVRGDADEVITVTTSHPGEWWEGSSACGGELSDAVEEYFHDEFGEGDNVSAAYHHNSFDVGVRYPLAVLFESASYNQEGELIEQSSLEFAEVVEATPPTGCVVSTAGEIQCSLPIYLKEVTSHLDEG